MISHQDKAELRDHLRRWQEDRRPAYDATEVAALLSDFEWVLDELDRISARPKPALKSLERLKLA